MSGRRHFEKLMTLSPSKWKDVRRRSVQLLRAMRPFLAAEDCRACFDSIAALRSREATRPGIWKRRTVSDLVGGLGANK